MLTKIINRIRKMNIDHEEIVVNGVTYTPKGSNNNPAPKLDGYDYVIVRAKDAGCWAGYLKSKSDNSVVLLQGRRLWHWQGAATLSQVAMDGFSKPDECKFPCEVTEVEIFNHCEIAKATSKAKSSIDSVAIWKA